VKNKVDTASKIIKIPPHKLSETFFKKIEIMQYVWADDREIERILPEMAGKNRLN
jgi:hypothetical protein